MRTQSRLSAVIIRLCRLCPTEIDVKVNLFQICDPRGEVAATSSHLVSQRQTESRFRPRQHVKSGSNYHCCSNICISESDKLLTVCDILTVSPAVQLSRQTHLTQQLLVCCFKSCSYHRKNDKNWNYAGKGTLWNKFCGKNSLSGCVVRGRRRNAGFCARSAVGGWLNDRRMQHMQKYQLQCSHWTWTWRAHRPRGGLIVLWFTPMMIIAEIIDNYLLNFLHRVCVHTGLT